MGATAALRSGLCGAQSKSWTEIEWESLQFYGAALGAGAQGTVRKAGRRQPVERLGRVCGGR
eukprot:COSAG01_NODE_4600_length_4887_cov_2.583542_1_plen_61_part_10